MKRISLEENKRIAYDTLTYFADFCESHGLHYFLAYGTLLGAVRHGGFIPWDDDIDVYMPREDYEKLLTSYKDELGGKYKLNAIENDPLFWLPFGKFSRQDTFCLYRPFFNEYVARLSIDVFPLDIFCASDDEDTARAEYKRYWESRTKIPRAYYCRRRRGWKALAKLIVYKVACLRYGSVAPRIKAWAHMMIDHPHQGQAAYLATAETTELYKLEWFQESVNLKFETGSFRAPVGYDSLLRMVYGDYMTPPPLNKREPHYDSQLYCIDDEHDIS